MKYNVIVEMLVSFAVQVEVQPDPEQVNEVEDAADAGMKALAADPGVAGIIQRLQEPFGLGIKACPQEEDWLQLWEVFPAENNAEAVEAWKAEMARKYEEEEE